MRKFLSFLSLFFTLMIILTSSSSFVFAKRTIIKSSPPIAKNVFISGQTEAQKVLTGNYTFYDPNGDFEAMSKYRWLLCDSLSGTYTPITNANSKTFTLTENETGKYIKFEVQPVSSKYPYTGITIQSATLGPILSSPAIVPEPTPLPPTRIVLGFATKYYSNDVSSYNSMVINNSSIDQIATVTYTADLMGNLLGTAPIDQIDFANINNIKPLAMIANNFDGQIAKSILENSIYRENFINNILGIMKTNGYQGVNLDFEGIFASNREDYSNLVIELKNSLSSLGYLFQISVPAKAFDNPTNSWNGAYDYNMIGQYADQVLLMTYDEHGPWGLEGPVASINWVSEVTKYSLTVIPKEKVLLGLAAYGYDWSISGNKALSINNINNIISQNNIIVQWDSLSQTPHFNYTDSSGIIHTIWYENNYSIAFKLNLVNENDLLGIGIWRLGLEDSLYWDKINTKLNK